MPETINTNAIKHEYADLFARQTVGFLVRRTIALMYEETERRVGQRGYYSQPLGDFVVPVAKRRLAGDVHRQSAPACRRYDVGPSDANGKTQTDQAQARQERSKNLARLFDGTGSCAQRVLLPPAVHRIWSRSMATRSFAGRSAKIFHGSWTD